MPCYRADDAEADEDGRGGDEGDDMMKQRDKIIVELLVCE